MLVFWRPQLIRIASTVDQNDGAHDLSHLERVWASARYLLNACPSADALTVMAASYLHDLVNLPKDHPSRNQASRMSALAADTALQALGFPQTRLAGVAHAIEAHSFSAQIEPTTIEAKIVQDADRIDALGAIGLARMFHVGGQLGRALAHPDDPMATQRPLDDMQFALDHIENKLLRLPQTMQTEPGRQLATERAQVLIDFRAQFVKEWRVV